MEIEGGENKNMEPDRKLCKFCGVELPFYLGFGEDLCPRCKGEVRDGIISRDEYIKTPEGVRRGEHESTTG